MLCTVLFPFGRYKAVHGDDHPLVMKSTQNIRNLTTKIVKAAQDDGQQQRQMSGALLQQQQLQQQRLKQRNH